MLRSKTVMDPRKSDDTHRRSLGQRSPMMQDCAPGCESPPSSRPNPVLHTISSQDCSTLAADSTLVGELSSSSSTPGQRSLPSRRPSNLSRMASSSGQNDLATLDEPQAPSCGQRSLPSRRPSNLSRESSSMGQQDLAALDESSAPSTGQRSLPSRTPSILGGHLFPLKEEFAIVDELLSSPQRKPLLCRPSNVSKKSLSSCQDVPTLDDKLTTVPRQQSMQKLVILSRKS
eukprot:gene13046-3584_t